MKIQNLAIFICLIFSSALSAQMLMGTKYIGGSVGFNSTTSKLDDAEARTSWSLSPEFGYFFKDNMAVGVGIGLNGSKQGDLTSSGFGGLVYVRKFWNASDKLHLFAGLNAEYGTNTVSLGSVDAKENAFGAFIDLGIWYHLSESWSVAGRFGNLGFTSTSNPDNDQDGETSFGLNVDTVNAPFSLGLYYGF